MPTLLVIDDEASILFAFREVFRDSKVTLLTAATATEGLQKIVQVLPDVVILDVNLPDSNGLEVFRRIRAHDAKIPVIFITAQASTSTAIEAMKLGAYYYLLKPLELDELTTLVERALEISRLMRVPAVMAEEEPQPESADVLIGRSPAMQRVYKSIGRVAPQDGTVLIFGESGTGKELVARAIYHHSNRSNAPFLAINCAAIPETLLESELFGHERGAFTGADRKRIGKFEHCSGGTLFLDEIGDMTPLTQTKILRLLQEQAFERVGGNETVKTNVRVIAATNHDLEKLVAAGQFRNDLFYRLSVFTITLPPLRERGDDLPLLVDHFLRRFNREMGKNVQSIAPEALELLRQHSWPGNLRELQSTLKQALLEATGPLLVPDFLPASLRAVRRTMATSESAAPTDSRPTLDAAAAERLIDERLRAGSENLYAEWMPIMERHLIARVLHHTGGNQLQAAKILGIDRGSLRAKIQKLGISIERNVW